eukprot:Skav213228  [mRNA]  locus=scaffold4407:63:791:+ [translate_table: standard]
MSVTLVIQQFNEYNEQETLSLIQAVDLGSMHDLMRALDQRVDSNNAVGEDTPLWYAVSGPDRDMEDAHSDIVECLLLARADPNRVCQNGLTVLMQVVWNDVDEEEQLEMVRVLCEQGANVNACTGEGYTALHFSAYYGNVALVEILLMFGAEVNAQTYLYPEPVHVVCFGREQVWFGRETALLCAAARGHVSCVICMIEAAADVSIPDAMGRSWVQIATGMRRRLLVAVQTTIVLPGFEWTF